MKEKPKSLKYMQKVQLGMTRWREKVVKTEFNHEDFQVEEVEVIIPAMGLELMDIAWRIFLIFI